MSRKIRRLIFEAMIASIAGFAFLAIVAIASSS